MKSTLLKLAVLICFAAVNTAAFSDVLISEVMPDSSHDNGITNDNGDWFEITNTGVSNVSLSGWEWVDDDSGHARLAFPDITIDAGQSIICLEESSADDWLSSWGLSSSEITVITDTDFGDFYGLGKSGDSVFLYDNTGALADSFTFTASSTGYSIDVFNGGVDSQLGVNGAWASDDIDGFSDIASPGTAVPEPLTLTLLAAGGLIIVRRKN